MDTLNIIEITNPFDHTKKERKNVPHVKGQPVLAYLEGPRSHNYVASINGRVLEEEELKTIIAQPGDYVVVCPVLQGGGGNDDKQILRIVALIAVMIVAPYVGAYFGATAASAAVWTAAVTVVGTMAVNAALPIETPRTKTVDDSPTYGADGPKNTAMEGIPVPLVYGGVRYAGNIIGNYVVNDAEGNQTLYVLINCGEGPVAPASEWKINDDLAADVGAEITFFDGSDEVNLANKIPYFSESITPISEGWRMTNSFRTFITAGEVDRVRLDFACPAGLYQIDSKGNESGMTVEIEIQYRKVGTTTWLDLPHNSSYSDLLPVDTWVDIQRPIGNFNPNRDPVFEVKPWAPTGSEVLSEVVYNDFGG